KPKEYTNTTSASRPHVF
ncbi:hypothetical protein SSYM_0511, partial [Serratia symbiotica str. Tucson]